MNNLKIYTGGFRLRNDDFDFLEDTIKDVIKGIVSAFAKKYNGNLILSGCELTLVNTQNGIAEYEVSEGYLLYNYEVIYCPLQQGIFAQSGAPMEFIIDTQYASTGTRIYANNVVHESHEVRRIVVQSSTQIGLDVDSIKNISDSIEVLLQNKYSEQNIYNNVVLQNLWSIQNSEFFYSKNATLKSLISTFEVSADFETGGVGYTELACILPIEYRPNKEIYGTCVVDNPSNPAAICAIKIKPNGEIYFIKTMQATHTNIKVNTMYH